MILHTSDIAAFTAGVTATAVICMLFVSACAVSGSGSSLRQTGAGEADAAASEPASHAGSPLAVGLEANAVVERVVDGDTVVVSIGGRSEAVRLLGIDTPESVDRSRPVQCYGEEASLRLAELLPAGTEVALVRDVEARDAYGRLLAYMVRSDDGLFVNLDLVGSGHAATLDYPPNDHYAEVLIRAESAAAAAGRGLWGACGGPDVPAN